MNDLDPALDVARRLALKAGAPIPRGLARLDGGRNNRVYRVETDGEPLILKLYHADPRDPRDRLDHEWRFLRHAQARGVDATPAPLARDHQAYAGLYSFAPGRKLAAEEIGADQMNKALAFILALNPPPAEGLPRASESCFSIAEHLATVDRRVDRLARLDAQAPLRDEAERLVRGELTAAWVRVRDRIEAAPFDLRGAIPTGEICVSPSDFGFHNALDDAGRLTFIDFEYAGLDDPAKLVGDTFACPDTPAPLDRFEAFVAGLAEGLGLSVAGTQRCRLLLDAYRVKWACIVLNDFLPLGADRRAFAHQGRSETHSRRQLDLARRSLDLIGAHI